MAVQKATQSRFERLIPPAQSRHTIPEKPVRLSMDDVYFLARIAARVRGFPDAALDEIAYRVVWLEQRGLPGLTYFTAELLENDDTALHARANFKYTPALTLTCPIYAGTLIKENFDDLVSGDENEINVIRGPSNPLLLLPKLAQYAAVRDVPIVVNWTTAGCRAVAARTIVYDHKIIQQGDLQCVVDADGIGLCLFTESLPDVFKGGDCKTALISPLTMLRLMAYCGRDMKPEPAVKPVPDDLSKIISHDRQLSALFRTLNTRERALIFGAATGGADTSLSTWPETRNAKFWKHLTAIGWLTQIPPAGLGLKSFRLTETGRRAIPSMMRQLQPHHT